MKPIPDITSTPADFSEPTLKDKYLQSVAQSCLEEFSAKKADCQGFKGHLYANYPKDTFNSEKFDEVIAAGKLDGFVEILSPLKFSNLMQVDIEWGFNKIDSQEFKSLAKDFKTFYKVTFDRDDVNKSVVTPLDGDKIWDKDNGGLDKDLPFIVMNPGLDKIDRSKLVTVSPEEFEDYARGEAKVFERGIRPHIKPEDEPEVGRQYLITVNSGGPSWSIIREHNAQPKGFETPYAKEQARLIYGPLVREIAPDGTVTRLEDEKILANLSNARNSNGSFGTITANCHINTLLAEMRALGTHPEVIEKGVESMRRIDGANVAARGSDISPRVVILQGSNDSLSEELGGRLPVSEDHVGTSVQTKGNICVVTQTMPDEVWHPGKKSTKEQRAQEDKIVQGVPKIYKRRLQNSEGEEGSKFAAFAKRAMIKSEMDGMGGLDGLVEESLKDVGLDGMRFRDDRWHHMAPLWTCEPTPGNDKGADTELTYKLGADMVTGKGFFKQQEKDAAKDASAPEDKSSWVERVGPKESATPTSFVEAVQAKKTNGAENSGGGREPS